MCRLRSASSARDGLHTTGADMLRFIAWNVDPTGDDLRELRQISQAAYLFRDGLTSIVGIDDAGPMAAMSLGWVISFRTATAR